MGWRALVRFPYEAEQSHGAYLGLCIFALWMSRRHLRYAVNCLFQSSHDDQKDSVSYRAAFLGVIIGLTFMMFFCLKIGMSSWVIILFFAIWLAISIAITRLRAELGSPVHDLHFIGPDEILPRMFGVRRIGATNLTGFAYLYFLNRAHRSHAMPHQLEGFKLANVANIPLPRFFLLMIFASGLGAISSFWAFLAISYSEGGSPVFANESFGRLERWLSFVTPPEIPAMVFVGIGFWVTILLSAMRMNFLWWNLHPVGYAISGSWAINPMIGSIFVGWFLKWIILKYGGRKWHRGAIPFFLGIVLGEFVIGTFWSLLGILSAQPMYRFLF